MLFFSCWSSVLTSSSRFWVSSNLDESSITLGSSSISSSVSSLGTSVVMTSFTVLMLFFSCSSSVLTSSSRCWVSFSLDESSITLGSSSISESVSCRGTIISLTVSTGTSTRIGFSASWACNDAISLFFSANLLLELTADKRVLITSFTVNSLTPSCVFKLIAVAFNTLYSSCVKPPSSIIAFLIWLFNSSSFFLVFTGALSKSFWSCNRFFWRLTILLFISSICLPNTFSSWSFCSSFASSTACACCLYW